MVPGRSVTVAEVRESVLVSLEAAVDDGMRCDGMIFADSEVGAPGKCACANCHKNPEQ